MEKQAKTKEKEQERKRRRIRCWEGGQRFVRGHGVLDPLSPMAVEHGSREGAEERMPVFIHATLDNMNPKVQTVRTLSVSFHNGLEMQAQVLVDVGAEFSFFPIGWYDSPRPRSFCMEDNKTRLPGGKKQTSLN